MGQGWCYGGIRLVGFMSTHNSAQDTKQNFSPNPNKDGNSIPTPTLPYSVTVGLSGVYLSSHLETSGSILLHATIASPVQRWFRKKTGKDYFATSNWSTVVVNNPPYKIQGDLVCVYLDF